MLGVPDFLGLHHDGRTDSEPHRPRHAYRYGWVLKCVAIAWPPLDHRRGPCELQGRSERGDRGVEPKRKLLSGLGVAASALARTQLLKWNSVTPSPSQLAYDVRREICDVLSLDVANCRG